MSNPNNSANVIGNLASAPKIMPHANGTSGTALTTVYARNNYRNKDGNTDSVRVDLEEFISDVNKPGAYAFLEEGMLVSVNYSIANADYTAKDGQQVYGMKLQVNRGGIQMLESKADTTARQNRKAQSVAQPQPQAQFQTQAPLQQTAMPQPSQNYAQAPVDPYAQAYLPGIPVAPQNFQDQPSF